MRMIDNLAEMRSRFTVSLLQAVVGGVVGYFVGKFSYVNVCADKFLIQAPNSNMAAAIRAKRGMPPRERDEVGD